MIALQQRPPPESQQRPPPVLRDAPAYEQALGRQNKGGAYFRARVVGKVDGSGFGVQGSGLWV